MTIPLSARIAALFVRDKYAYWLTHFTDEERKLREMDVMELAAALHEAQVRRDDRRRIVVEYMLGSRLARLQSKASWGSGILAFVGAVLGAGIPVAATTLASSTTDPRVFVTCATSTQLPINSTPASPASSDGSKPTSSARFHR